MNRRAVVTALGTVLVAPLQSYAQTAKNQARVGMLGSTPVAPALYDMFKRGLGQLGYVDKQNVLIVESDAGDVPARLPVLAAELVRTKVNAMFVRGACRARCCRKGDENDSDRRGRP